DIRGRSLYRRVEGLTFAQSADSWIRMFELRQIAAAAEHGRGVSVPICLGHHGPHELAHLAERTEVPVDEFLRFVGGDAEPLRQPEPVHAVGEPEVDRLRALAKVPGNLVDVEPP